MYEVYRPIVQTMSLEGYVFPYRASRYIEQTMPLEGYVSPYRTVLDTQVIYDGSSVVFLRNIWTLVWTQSFLSFTGLICQLILGFIKLALASIQRAEWRVSSPLLQWCISAGLCIAHGAKTHKSPRLRCFLSHSRVMVQFKLVLIFLFVLSREPF